MVSPLYGHSFRANVACLTHRTNEASMDIGFIGLGNLGGNLARSVLRGGFELTVHDLDPTAAADLVADGATWAHSPAEVAAASTVVITCLPSPVACAAVMEGADGVLAGLRPTATWIEMSTTDVGEVRRLADLVVAAGGAAADCPVSGGCHRAETGNIAMFVGCERAVFERVLPVLAVMGREILHTGGIGSASVLKVVTNYLASAHLVALGEALTIAHVTGADLGVAFEAIRLSSGNSFVHETEGQLILNGSRDIGFTLDLVRKDTALFAGMAARGGVELDLAPVLVDVFADAIARYGSREWSTNVVRRLEDATGAALRAPGFPAALVDDIPPAPGREVVVEACDR